MGYSPWGLRVGHNRSNLAYKNENSFRSAFYIPQANRQILYHRFFPIWEAHDKLQPSDEESLVVKSIECFYQHTRTTLESVRKVTEGHWVSPL